MGGEERDTTPNPAQKPRRGRRVSVPSPSRSLSRCEHARINPHPPSSAIRPRGGAEAAHPFAHSRGKRRGAFAPPCGLPTPLALASAARPRRRRNASRHVASSTSARDDHHPLFAASIPRPPSSPPHSPQATRGRGRPALSARASEPERRLRPARFRATTDDVGDAPDEPPDSAGPRRTPDPPRRPGRRADAIARLPGAPRRIRRRRPRRRGEGWCSATGASSTPRRAARRRGGRRGRDDDAGVAADDAGEGERGEGAEDPARVHDQDDAEVATATSTVYIHF